MTARKHYKPISTQTPVLVILLLVTLALIGVTEYACRNIPVHHGFGKLDKVINNTLKHVGQRDVESRAPFRVNLDLAHILLPRQVVDSSTSSTSTDTDSLSSSTTTQKGTSTVTGPGHLTFGDGSTTPPPDGSTSSTITSDVPFQTSGLLVPGSGSVTAPPPEVQTALSTDSFTGAPNTGYVIPGPGASTPTPDPTPVPIVVVASGKTSTFTPSDKVSPTPGQIVSSVMVVSGSSQTILVTQGSTSTAGRGLTVISGQTYTASSSPSVTVINGQSYTIIAVASTSQSKASNVLNNIRPTSTFVNATGTYLKWSNQGITRYPQITLQQYIQVAILPLILALLYAIPWRILDSTIREMEPFYQLSRPGGATAEKSLCLDYGISFFWATPFKSISRGHFIVFWSSLVSVVVLFLAPLSSEAMFVSLTGTCGPNLPEDSPPCYAVWGVYPAFARAIQGVLAFVAVLVILLIIFNFRRTSGTYSEPLSIAGLAALIYKSPLLHDLREIDSKATNSEIKSLLAGKRYKIDEFTAADNTPCYGIVPVNPDYEAGFATVPAKYTNVNVTEVGLDTSSDLLLTSTQTRMRHFWWSVQQNTVYVLALLLFAGMLALLSYYHWTSYESKFEEFMDSSSFGVRLLMTTMGVVIKLIWGRIDSDLRKLEPYHRLLLGNANPSDSILVPSYQSPLSAILPSLRKRHFLVALTCFVSFISEFLPLFLANSIFSPAMTKLTYSVCNAFSMTVLFLMIFTIIGLVLRPRRSVKPLPRMPYTVASVLVYLASREEVQHGGMTIGTGLGLLEGMRGFSVLDTEERNHAIRGLGALYSMGLVRGDGLRIDDDRRIGKLWSG